MATLPLCPERRAKIRKRAWIISHGEPAESINATPGQSSRELIGESALGGARLTARLTETLGAKWFSLMPNGKRMPA